MRIVWLNSQKYSRNLGVVKGQNEHNHENQLCPERSCVNFVVLVVINKRLNCSRHHVHLLASKSDSLWQRKVQGHKVPLPTQWIFKCTPLLFALFSFNFIHVGDCEQMGFENGFWLTLSQNKCGTHMSFEKGSHWVMMSSVRRITSCGHLLKTVKEWIRN